MGPIVYEFDGPGSLNRSRFLVHPPLSRFLNVSPYSLTSIDTHYASHGAATSHLFFCQTSWVKVYYYLFVVGKRRPKKWPLCYGLAGVSAYFTLVSIGGFFGFPPSIAFCFLHIHRAHTTHARSSSLQSIHPPPIYHHHSIVLILIVHPSASNH